MNNVLFSAAVDPDYRLSRMFTIRNKDGDTVQFVPNMAQQHYHQHRHTRNIYFKVSSARVFDL